MQSDSETYIESNQTNIGDCLHSISLNYCVPALGGTYLNLAVGKSKKLISKYSGEVNRHPLSIS